MSVQTYTTDEAREELALFFTSEQIEDLMDTAQDHGQVTAVTPGSEITLLADDDAQCWLIKIAAVQA